ncbi:polysaccharide deacetylase family protein [Erythrobacter sp. HKB08]|uniref:polysaccharide deacetylase family protein n=1 Tax=Erythrobacter sp. HKB08 TaxID=2502843 RepID=UPI0010087322|nr:polysaccharide deacetylase family protein [Erythrobacter sp. HKB08]
MDRSIIEPPPAGSKAQFAPDFGQRALLTVDTEEEFDWDKPFSAEGHGLGHVPRLAKFQQFCEGLGVVPLYLIDYPIATSPEAAEILSGPVRQGKAEIGIQLHPWVNPPFEEDVTAHNSFAGNLPRELEREKFARLKGEIERNFQTAPMIYRAGRYGLGPDSGEMLVDAGVAIDTSVRPLWDYSPFGGRNYLDHPLEPYWVDEAQSLLELPLTTVHWGLLRELGRRLSPMLEKVNRLPGLFTKLGLLERIPLTPEGVSVEEAIRGIDIALDDGLPLLVLSFHSPSLVPGNTPYVRSEEDLDRLYDWWRRVYGYLELRSVKPTSVEHIMRSVVRK